MSIDRSRIDGAVSTTALRASHVVTVGCGGSAELLASLARCGVGRFTLCDPDRVAPSNLARQGFEASDVGRHKVEAVAEVLTRIDPACTVRCLCADITTVTADTLGEHLSGASLLIAATDRFVAQARVNELALASGIPALWPGIYEGGLAGEVIFWHPGLPCYRCLVPSRYQTQEAARAAGNSVDPASDGTTVFDQAFIDSIAGMIALGLLTRGCRDRFGTLIELLGDRNFIQVKNDPRGAWRGRDVVREQLRVPGDADTYFSWITAARRDPDLGRLHCPDCERLLGKSFPLSNEHGVMA